MHLIATSFYEPDNVTFYNVVLFIHIAAAIAAFGGTFGYGIVAGILSRPDQRRHIPFWHTVQHELGTKLITPGAVVILLAGIYLSAVGNYDFGKTFVTLGIVFVVLLLGSGHAFFMPTEKRAAEIAERDIAAAGSGEVELSPEYQALAKRLAIVGIAANIVILAAVFVMVMKPL